MEFFELLWGTILLRPYVFVFLACYLTIATWNMGFRRAVLFTLLAYTIAFLSEYSSTRNGFPYGFYSYIETTRDRELWVANVPFMDSLSYSFLAYVSYTLSLLVWSPLQKQGWDIRIVDLDSVKHSLRVVLTGAFLFMMLDVVIDPVAFLGDRWFLGKIYTYQEEGEYFNIPLTNFAGWLLVGFAILFSFTRLDAWLTRRGFRDIGIREVPGKALLGPALYFGVLIFNLAITFYIGEWVMGLCGLGWSLVLFSIPAWKVLREQTVSENQESPVIGK
jgi:putative membrane protein